MNGKRLTLSVLGLVLVAGMVPPTASAQVAPPCVVAVMSGGAGIELPQLHNTLTALGVTWVDVATLADAQNANASVIIDRYDGTNLSSGDIATWLNSGKGYIQLGDWPDLFPNSWTGFPSGQPITVTVADPTSPLAAGLAASWTGRGFWAYDWDEDAIGWTTDTALPDVVEATYNATTYTRVVSSELVGSGRAVYIGINVYGSDAGPNELALLTNALTWAGACRIAAPEPIPALGWLGMAVLMLAIALLGIALVARLR